MFEPGLNMASKQYSVHFKMYGIETNVFIGKHKPGYCVFKTHSVH